MTEWAEPGTVLHDFLCAVLDRTEEFVCGEEYLTSREDFKLHLDLLEQSVGALNQIPVTLCDDGSDGRKLARELKMAFVDLRSQLAMMVPYHSKTDISSLAVPTHKEASAVIGLPADAPLCGGTANGEISDILADLRCHGFAWVKIAHIFKVSR